VIVTAEPGEAAAVSGWLALGADDCLVRPYQPALDAHRVEAARLKRTYRHQVQDLLRVVIPLSARLSTEADFNGLLERILVEAKDFCSADAGTLYLRTDEETLRFVLVRNDSLGLNMGGRSGGKVTLPDIPLYEIRPGQPSLPNHHNVASYAAHTEQTVNIPDAYHTPDFDFSGTRSFDARTGYHSVSFLTVPLRDNIDEVIGVLQLINARDVFTGDIIPFSPHLEPIVESIASLATVALKAYIREQQLRQQIGAPTISVDGERTERDVTQITETKYFQQLQDRARNLRGRARSDSTSAAGDRVDVDVQPG
jgi:GAF domain-containing protein